jgi:ceramide glucosyltransferase
VRLDRDLLARLAAPLGDPKVGIATALYRGVPAGGFSSSIEALAINADFVPSVLVAEMLGDGIRFALGAANAVRREALAAIGGIGSLGEVLADDHLLGKRIAEKGFGVRIAPAVVPIVQDSSARDTFARLLRWCRTVRVCQPAGYAATIISHHGVAAALGAWLLACVAAGACPPFFERTYSAPPILTEVLPWLVAAVIALRVATATIAHSLIAGRKADLASMALLPLRDLIATGLFVLAWSGSSVTWRGRRFRVLADGTFRNIDSFGPEPEHERDRTIPLPLLTAGGPS